MLEGRQQVTQLTISGDFQFSLRGTAQETATGRGAQSCCFLKKAV